MASAGRYLSEGARELASEGRDPPRGGVAKFARKVATFDRRLASTSGKVVTFRSRVASFLRNVVPPSVRLARRFGPFRTLRATLVTPIPEVEWPVGERPRRCGRLPRFFRLR